MEESKCCRPGQSGENRPEILQPGMVSSWLPKIKVDWPFHPPTARRPGHFSRVLSPSGPRVDSLRNPGPSPLRADPLRSVATVCVSAIDKFFKNAAIWVHSSGPLQSEKCFLLKRSPREGNVSFIKIMITWQHYNNTAAVLRPWRSSIRTGSDETTALVSFVTYKQ